MSNQKTIEKIKENQQQRLFQSELIIIVVFLGLLLNIFSSFIYDNFISVFSANTILSFLMFVLLIGGIIVLFIKHYFTSDPRVQIYNYSYDVNFGHAYRQGIEREIGNKLDKTGLSIISYNKLIEKFEHTLKKLVSDDSLYKIGNRIIKSIKHEENDRKIIIDISKNEVDAQLVIHLIPLVSSTILNTPDELEGLYTELSLDIYCYLNDSKQKNSLEFYNDFQTKGSFIVETIKSYLLIILAHQWNLIDKTDIMYNIIENLELDKLE